MLYVQVRPFAREFLVACASVFTLYVYTAGRKQYADSILDVLDTHRLIEKRFYRDSCVYKGRNLVKSLKKLPRHGEAPMYLVDDNLESIRLNAPFGVGIRAFEGDQGDRQLVETFGQLIDLYH